MHEEHVAEGKAVQMNQLITIAFMKDTNVSIVDNTMSDAVK